MDWRAGLAHRAASEKRARPPSPPCWEFIGSYGDSAGVNRVLSYQSTPNVHSVPQCAAQCAAADPLYIVVGIQNTGECWCARTVAEATRQGVHTPGCTGFDGINYCACPVLRSSLRRKARLTHRGRPMTLLLHCRCTHRPQGSLLTRIFGATAAAVATPRERPLTPVTTTSTAVPCFVQG